MAGREILHKMKAGICGAAPDMGRGKSKMWKNITHGFHFIKGKSNHPMEDYVVSEFKKVDGHELGLFAIFDGHLGHDVAKYLQTNLFDNILQEKEFWTDTENAIRNAYRSTDAVILQQSLKLGKGGSTALPSSPSPRSATSPLKGFGSAPCLKALVCDTWTMALRQQKTVSHVSSSSSSSCDSSDVIAGGKKTEERLPNTVTELDLRHLVQLVERKDGGQAWIQMMDRFTPGMRYQAWLREPKNGPTEYRSRTVFEDATPEMLRDFFWDDEFRPTWDTMLASSTTVEECTSSGTMIVRWIRKFPFFCSDREYVIGRRIWNCGKSYYCVTKGVSVPCIPRNNKQKRVELFYSSWCIRPVESRREDGVASACEVLLFHHEDMGIPREIAKLGVKIRQPSPF